VRVAEDDPRAHPDELVDEEQAVLEHFLEDEHGASRLGRHRKGDRRQVRREGWPRPVFDLRDLRPDVVLDRELLTARDAYGVLAEIALDAEPLEAGPDSGQVFRDHILDQDVPVRDRREPDEARHLDVVGADAPFPPAQTLDASDSEHVGADAVNVGAEGDEKAAEVLDVRLAGGIGDRCLALCEDGGHEHVLGRRHGCLVEEDVSATQALGAHRVAPVRMDVRPEPRQRVNVCVEPPAPDHVATGRRDDRLAAACE
jgi:hypothetical protein